MVTSALVAQWCAAVRATGSLASLRHLVRAYRLACHFGDTEEQVGPQPLTLTLKCCRAALKIRGAHLKGSILLLLGITVMVGRSEMVTLLSWPVYAKHKVIKQAIPCAGFLSAKCQYIVGHSHTDSGFSHVHAHREFAKLPLETRL